MISVREKGKEEGRNKRKLELVVLEEAQIRMGDKTFFPKLSIKANSLRRTSKDRRETNRETHNCGKESTHHTAWPYYPVHV